MRVLYVLGDVPARGSGWPVRAASTLAALARAADVSVLYPARAGLQPDAALAATPRVQIRALPPPGPAGRLASAAGQLARGRPFALARSVKPSLVAAVREALASGRYDAVVADGPSAAVACLDAGLARAPVRSCYNSHNLEWRLRRRGSLSQRLSWVGLRRVERRIVATFGESWAVSEADLAGLRALAPRAALRLVPNALELGSIKLVKPGREPVVLMVASFDYSPNLEGLEWLVTRVMPAVWEQRPEARLELVGRGEPGRLAARDRRITALGFVPDLAPAYARARVCAAPLLTSGGTPFKVIEALTYGLPLVATGAAVRALGPVAAIPAVQVGEAPEAFAAALVAFLDPAYQHQEAATEGRRLVTSLYSVDAIAREVARSLE